ncbi:MAG: hypothetical protein ACRDZ7_07155 [Acidimicrobiia bacterium]
MGRRTAQRLASNVLLALGSLAMVLGLVAGAAGAIDSGDYQDRNFSVDGGRRYDGKDDRTVFAFRVTGDGPAEYFLINACETGARLLRAFGPDDQQPVGPGPDQSTGHESLKFEPGNLGTYTVIYRGDIDGAEFIIKNGDGHRHHHVGTGCPSSTEVTTSTRERRASTTTEKKSTTTTTDKKTTTSTGPTTTTMEPTTTTMEPTTTTDSSATSVTLAALPDPGPPQRPDRGSGPVPAGLLFAGLPLALSGVAVRFGDPDERD